MSCVLRVFGKAFDVEGYFKNSKLKPCAVWKRGQKIGRSPKWSQKMHVTSGFNLDVSKKDFDQRKQQIEDATKFLVKHKRMVKRLVSFPGVETVSLSFGFMDRPRSKDAYAHGVTLPSKLLQSAGSIGLEIEMTFYTCSD